VSKYPVHRQATRREESGERVALQVLHDQVVDAPGRPDVVQRTDIRVVEIRNRAGFALEAMAGVEICRSVRKQHLDRHPSAESKILRAVDFAHAAGAQEGVKPVGAQFGARLETLGSRHSDLQRPVGHG
jgi:hypothetical protein